MLHSDVLLYHFTSDKQVDSCLKEGLTLGCTFIGRTPKGVQFLRSTQWLTTNPDFNQSWSAAELSKLPYDRTDNRLTICIPHNETKNLVSWTTFGPVAAPKTYEVLSSFGDPENWYVYLGSIPPEWIIERVKKGKL